MEHGRVRAAADDRSVRGPRRAAPAEVILEHRLELVFEAARARARRRRTVRLERDRRRAAHDLDLRHVLEQPHLVQDRPRIDDLRRRNDARSRAQPHLVERRGELRVERAVAPEDDQQPPCAFDQLRDVVEELSDRMRLAGAEVADGPFDARPVARPRLGVALARLGVERERGAAVGPQHRRGVRVVEAREVVEVAVLPEREVRVGGARRELRPAQQRDRIRAHLLEESPPPLRVHARSLPKGARAASDQGRSAHTTSMPSQ